MTQHKHLNLIVRGENGYPDVRCIGCGDKMVIKQAENIINAHDDLVRLLAGIVEHHATDYDDTEWWIEATEFLNDLAEATT